MDQSINQLNGLQTSTYHLKQLGAITQIFITKIRNKNQIDNGISL